MKDLTPKKETVSLRPVPWRSVIICTIIGALLYAGVVYMYIQKTSPPTAHRNAPAKTSTPSEPIAGKVLHTTQTTKVIASEKMSEAREGLDQLVTAARQQLEKAHALAAGPEAAKLRAKIEETRVQIENYSYKGADKAGDALGRAVANSKEIATELRSSGKGELATNVEKTVSEWKEGAAKLVEEGREIVSGSDTDTTR